MSTAPTSEAGYALGHADDELSRLSLQASVLESTTRRLIADGGVRPGMRVLDLGCGTGEASFLLAEAVGPDGSVLGLDREAAAVSRARQREVPEGCADVTFEVGDETDAQGHGAFDAVLIRYVLIHQADPVAFLRLVGRLLKPGGLILSEEAAFHLGTRCDPPVPLWSAMFDTIVAFTARAFPHNDVAGRIHAMMAETGMQVRHAAAISAVGGARSRYLAYGVASYRAFLPAIQRLDLVRNDVGDPDTLESRINAAMEEAGAQFIGCPEVIVSAEVDHDREVQRTRA